MGNSIISESAKIERSTLGEVKIFRNVSVMDSVLCDGVSIGDDTTVERCRLERNVVINRRSYVNDSIIGDYTNIGINLTMNWTKVGKFCSIARNVDIGGDNHDYHKVTTVPMFRFLQMQNGGGKVVPDSLKSHNEYCEIGNDVWIAAGANILHKVKVADGAVVGAGAVVTHDVPPYAIVAGVPARIIGYRFDRRHIDELLEICWWNWPNELIVKNMKLLIESDVNDETILKLRQIAYEARSHFEY